jgi:hypothetical protein
MENSMSKIKWLEQPEQHDYPAAESYLSLFLERDKVETLIHNLKHAKIVSFKAKDIFRASGLSLLGVSNSHVKKNIKKIKKGIALSPIILVRNKDRVIVADGYHRLCAVYQFNEDIDIPCKIV